ncbi:MAG: RodZ domain-containing protein [Thermodesulfobacteriota bacterium]
MSNAGASWKTRRESMGKSIEDAGAALRISHRYLRGIEEGNYAGWPEKVFSAGFIRSYAKYLSVDPGPVLAEYERILAAQPERQEAEARPQPQSRPEWLERERERGSRRTSYVFAAGVVLLVGVVLAYVSMRGPARPVAPPPAAPAAPAPVPAPEISAAPAAVPGIDNAPATAGAAAIDPAAVPDNAARPHPTVSAVGGGGPLTGPFQLFLEASEHTWLMYSFDDGDPIDVTLYMGDKISIQANRRIRLKIGNAGGVVGTLNGNRLPPFGAGGQVVEVQYP